MARKKRKFEDESNVDIGLVMTVSLFLILLTFFILLNSIAVLDDRRVRVAIGSLTGAFGSFSGGLSPMKMGESIMPPSAPLVTDPLDLQQMLSSAPAQVLDHIKVEQSKHSGKISINERVLFIENSAELKRESSQILDKLCDYMRQGVYSIEIIGHTDNRPGSEKGYGSNWELSSLMSAQVLKYFHEKGKLSPSRMTAYGRAGFSPLESNDTRQSRALNRRVDIILNFESPSYTRRIFKERPAGIFTYKRFNFKIF